MEEIINLISTNKTWIFSGVGVAIILGVIRFFKNQNKESTVSNTATGSGNIQAGGDINIQKEEKKN